MSSDSSASQLEAVINAAFETPGDIGPGTKGEARDAVDQALAMP